MKQFKPTEFQFDPDPLSTAIEALLERSGLDGAHRAVSVLTDEIDFRPRGGTDADVVDLGDLSGSAKPDHAGGGDKTGGPGNGKGKNKDTGTDTGTDGTGTDTGTDGTGTDTGTGGTGTDTGTGGTGTDTGTGGTGTDTGTGGTGTDTGTGGTGTDTGTGGTGTDTGTGGTDTGGTGTGEVIEGYVSGGDAATSYNVEIIFSGTWTASLQQAFIDAADYLSSIIIGDVADVNYNNQIWDDMVISASLVEIDGPYGVLGQAGPQLARSGTYHPFKGLMEFDVADAQTFDDRGQWDDIVFHEMMHAIGFGTLWNLQGLTSGSVSGGDMRFTGEMATALYNSEFSDLAANDPGSLLGVPIETDGGAGTAGGHWDDATFGGEIMTGYISGTNHLSHMSVAALEDMGYDTILDNPNDPDDLSAPWPGDPVSDAPIG
ncbi:leishmanolysin-related zinc metalloendopeptidase [Litorisediminicola beolgyonensis]|uniref:Leishmanolysin-related zinc metalloendopeptidase n=1 Tax=Litorisediminicola beolgyonensis TaxID=1173614 RepID=A0ABW3ZM54_9RHOB